MASLRDIKRRIRSVNSTKQITKAMEMVSAAKLRERGRAVETVVREGYPATAIEEEARSRHADLVVIGTRGHSGLKHLLLGSVAERVVQKAPCPVLAVKTPE